MDNYHMACVVCPKARAAWEHVRRTVVQYFRSFTIEQWKIAFQICLNFLVIGGITAATTVYEAISYRLIAPPLALLFTVWLYSSPFCAGEVNFKIVSLIPAAFIGGLIAFGIERAMYAANDYNWDDDSVTKAAVLVCMATPIAAGINILRWSSEATNVFFFYVNIFIALSISLGSYYAPEIKDLHQWYILANAAIGTGTCAIGANFVFPVTAGYRYRIAMGECLKSFADAWESMKVLLLEEIDPETGRLMKASSVVNPDTGYDEGMEKRTEIIEQHLRKSRALIEQTRRLHFPVLFEVDIYSRPRRFPRHQFMHAKILVSAAMSTMTAILRPMESGNVNFSLFQHPRLKENVKSLCSSVQDMLRHIADAVNRKGTWDSVDTCMENMDESWRQIVSSLHEVFARSTDREAAHGLFTGAEMLYHLGIRMRAVYGSFATAVNPTDTTALSTAKSRILTIDDWVHPSTALANDKAHAKLNTGESEASSATENGEDSEGGGYLKDILLNSTENDVDRNILRKVMYGHKSNKVLRSGKAYGMPISVLFGIQYGVAIGITLILASIPAVAEYAFIDRPFDVIITVVVVWVPNIGTTTTRGVQRVIGTLLTAAVSYVILSFSYLAAGLTWNNEPGKFIVGWALSSIYAGFCVLNGMRDPAREYLWSVANFTLATTTLPVFRADSPWRRLAQRSANMIIGGLIIWLVAVLVFPISTRWMTQVNFSACFESLTKLLKHFTGELVPREKDDRKEEHRETSSNSSVKPGGVRLRAKSQEDQALVRFLKSETFEIAFHAQMTIGYITSNIAELEKEFLFTTQPRQVPKDLSNHAARSLQELLDIVKMLHLVKIESHPFDKWPISPSHYSYVENFAENFIETLNFLSRAVLKPGTSIDEVIEKLEATDIVVREHIYYNMKAQLEDEVITEDDAHCIKRAASLSKKDKPQGGDNVTIPDPLACTADILNYMEDPITFLNYLEVCCCRQLRSLILAVLHSVLITEKHKILFEEKVSAKLSKAHEDTTKFESGSGMEAEYLMAEFEDILQEQRDLGGNKQK